MRRLTLTTAAIAAALALASCGGTEEGNAEGTTDGAASSEASSQLPAGDEMPAVEGEFGAQPEITFPETGAPADLRVEVLSEGDGDEVQAGDYVLANYHGRVWGGTEPFDDSFSRPWESNGLPIFSLNQVVDGWKEGLPGTHVGDRVLLSIPSEMGYPEGNPQAGINPGDALVFVVDVLGRYGQDEAYSQADAKDTGEIANLPVTVEGALGSQPTISVIEGSPEPTEVTTTVIAEGNGPAIAEGGVAVVAYSIVAWDNTPGGDSWSNGAPQAVPIPAGTVFDSLVGTPAGSRAVIQMPPSDGTPSAAAVVEVLDFIPMTATE